MLARGAKDERGLERGVNDECWREEKRQAVPMNKSFASASLRSSLSLSRRAENASIVSPHLGEGKAVAEKVPLVRGRGLGGRRRGCPARGALDGGGLVVEGLGPVCVRVEVRAVTYLTLGVRRVRVRRLRRRGGGRRCS